MEGLAFGKVCAMAEKTTPTAVRVRQQQRRYPPEARARAVRLVQQAEPGSMRRIARQLDVHYETLRQWVRQAEVDAGGRPGLTTEEREELRRLRKENYELRRANEILKSASAFFARELDQTRTK
jgi:transposase